MPIAWPRMRGSKRSQEHWHPPTPASGQGQAPPPAGGGLPDGEQGKAPAACTPPGPVVGAVDPPRSENGGGPDYGILVLDQEELQKAILDIGSELKTIKAQLAQLLQQNEKLVKNIEYQDFINMAVGMASAKRQNTPQSRAEFAQLMAHLPSSSAPAGEWEAEEGGPAPEHAAPAPTVQKPPPAPAKKKKSIGAKIANLVFYLCLALLVVGALLFAKSTDPQKSLFGFRYYYIKSASMVPVYPVGSVVVTKSVLPEEIQVGDDITVYVSEDGDTTYLTHRVVEITTDSAGELAFRTRGVNNKTNDPTPFNAKLVVGRVVLCIPMLGTVMTFVTSQLWLVVGIFVLLVALAFMLRLLFSKEEPEPAAEAEKSGPKQKKRKGPKPAKAPSKERVVWKAKKQERAEEDAVQAR